MLRPIVVASLLYLGGVSAAHADVSYSYLDGALAKTSTDYAALGELDGVSGDFTFSYELLSFLYVFGGYEYSEIEDTSLDGELVQAGAGVHYDPSETSSVYFTLAGLTAEQDLSTGLGAVRAEEDGYGYALGYRESNATGRIEFLIAAEHYEFDDANDTWINMGLDFRVTPRFRVTTRVRFAGEQNAARVGFRYFLPNRFDRRRD